MLPSDRLTYSSITNRNPLKPTNGSLAPTAAMHSLSPSWVNRFGSWVPMTSLLCPRLLLNCCDACAVMAQNGHPL
jgi:hypothetical protein